LFFVVVLNSKGGDVLSLVLKPNSIRSVWDFANEYHLVLMWRIG